MVTVSSKRGGGPPVTQTEDLFELYAFTTHDLRPAWPVHGMGNPFAPASGFANMGANSWQQFSARFSFDVRISKMEATVTGSAPITVIVGGQQWTVSAAESPKTWDVDVSGQSVEFFTNAGQQARLYRFIAVRHPEFSP